MLSLHDDQYQQTDDPDTVALETATIEGDAQKYAVPPAPTFVSGWQNGKAERRAGALEFRQPRNWNTRCEDCARRLAGT